MIWRAWYTDAEYSGREMKWTDLPATGLVVAVTYDAGGKTIHGGGDWYNIVSGTIEVRSVPLRGERGLRSQ